MTSIAVLAAGGIGALCRYLVNRMVHERTCTEFPWATALVNLSGAVGLGLAVGLAASGHLSANVLRVIGVGFFGSYTTFSTWMVESSRLFERGSRAGIFAGFSNTLGLAIAGVLAAAAGSSLGRVL